MYNDTKSGISYLVGGAHPFADTLKLQKSRSRSVYVKCLHGGPKRREHFYKLITRANYVMEQHSIYE